MLKKKNEKQGEVLQETRMRGGYGGSSLGSEGSERGVVEQAPPMYEHQQEVDGRPVYEMRGHKS